VITIIISLILSSVHDGFGEWWYFISPIAGSVTVGAVAFLTVFMATEANYRAAFKSRYSVKYAHKVVYRAGMASIFISFSIGLIVIQFLLGIYEMWYADNDKANYGKMVHHLFPFALGVSLTVVGFKVGGLLYESSTNVGEIVIYEGNRNNGLEEMERHPGTTSYCVGEVMG